MRGDFGNFRIKVDVTLSTLFNVPVGTELKPTVFNKAMWTYVKEHGLTVGGKPKVVA